MLRPSVLIAIAAFSTPALADTHVAYTDADGKPGIQVYVKDGKVRMENGVGQPISIFDTANPALIVMNPADKRYSVFDQETAQHLGAEYQEAQRQLDEATKKLEKQGENLADKLTTVSQHGLLQTLVGHALVDYMIKLIVPNGFALHMQLKPLGTHQTIMGLACDDEQLIINDKPAETRCVAHDTSKLGIPAADQASLQTMLDDYKQILTAIEPMAPGINATMPDGMPVKSQKITWDQATKTLGTRTDTLAAITTETLPASLFTPPADYSLVKLEVLNSASP